MTDRINPPGVWAPKGRGFNMAVAPPTGQLVHFTGQVAWDAQEQIVGQGDISVQTRQCFKNISILLDHIGGKLEDIVSLTTYYTDPAQLPAIQKVRAEFLRDGTAPASTSVMVAGLGHPDFLVELTPVAVIPMNRYRPPK